MFLTSIIQHFKACRHQPSWPGFPSPDFPIRQCSDQQQKKTWLIIIIYQRSTKDWPLSWYYPLLMAIILIWSIINHISPWFLCSNTHLMLEAEFSMFFFPSKWISGNTTGLAFPSFTPLRCQEETFAKYHENARARKPNQIAGTWPRNLCRSWVVNAQITVN